MQLRLFNNESIRVLADYEGNNFLDVSQVGFGEADYVETGDSSKKLQDICARYGYSVTE